jgi:hypothetical protein
MATHREVSRMATTLQVGRIDIVEGPNLDELQRAQKFAVPRGEIRVHMSARFDYVVYFDEAGSQLTELGRTFLPQVIGIRYLGDEPSRETQDDFVITVRFAGMTFEGHYNVHSRKGSLSVKK